MQIVLHALPVLHGFYKAKCRRSTTRKHAAAPIPGCCIPVSVSRLPGVCRCRQGAWDEKCACAYRNGRGYANDSHVVVPFVLVQNQRFADFVQNTLLIASRYPKPNVISGSRYEPSVHSFQLLTVINLGAPGREWQSDQSLARRSTTSNFCGIAFVAVG